MSPTSPPWRGQLSHIALRCEDAGAAADFYCDVVGLTPHPPRDGSLALGWGAGAHALELLDGEPGLDHFAIEIPDREELTALRERVAAAGVEVTPLDEEGHADGFSLVDPDGRPVEFHGRIDRSGEKIADLGWRPRRLQHITLATPSLQPMLDFYLDVLGFRLSDRMGDVFAWMRCGTEHHTVAVVERETARKLDHFSFDLDGWADFKAWCDHLAQLGVRIDWGPGRHGPGNNIFLMFEDLDGYHLELSCEMEQYFDDVAEYPTRIWDASDRAVNLWGSVPSWRAPQVA